MLVILIILSIILAGATFCACFKPGKTDGISKYDYLED
jgi:hypothetical protein